MSDAMKSTLWIVIIAGALMATAGCQDSRDAGRSSRGPDPKLAREENDRAYGLIKDGKYEEAKPMLLKAVDADVTFGPAHNNLGLIYFHEGDWYKAAWEFYNASKLMPYQPDVRNNLGMALELDTTKYNQAIAEYEKARSLAPDNPEYLANLARAKDKRGDRDEEMKKLLQELAYKDPRQEWRDWARMRLFKLGAPVGGEAPPTTAPAVH
jgi:Flp pilus assembly protein TadD